MRGGIYAELSPGQDRLHQAEMALIVLLVVMIIVVMLVEAVRQREAV